MEAATAGEEAINQRRDDCRSDSRGLPILLGSSPVFFGRFRWFFPLF